MLGQWYKNNFGSGHGHLSGHLWHLALGLVKKQLLSPAAFDDIDWPAMEMVSNLFPPLYHLWVTKHVSGFLALEL